MLQQTPRSVTVEPQSLVTFPPEVAELFVIPVTLVVVTVGKPPVEKIISLP